MVTPSDQSVIVRLCRKSKSFDLQQDTVNSIFKKQFSLLTDYGDVAPLFV
ncbi:hypothetical protein J518_2136 [Acinetobacter baumannii 1419130]|nr:hypothetical protein J518_2136 [Acinetobacter baumannii 1419130]